MGAGMTEWGAGMTEWGVRMTELALELQHNLPTPTRLQVQLHDPVVVRVRHQQRPTRAIRQTARLVELQLAETALRVAVPAGPACWTFSVNGKTCLILWLNVSAT